MSQCLELSDLPPRYREQAMRQIQESLKRKTKQKEEKETNLTEFERLTCKKASKSEFVKVLSQSFLNVSRFSESESNAACPLWPR